MGVDNDSPGPRSLTSHWIRSNIGDMTNVLLLAPSNDERTKRACQQLLLTVEPIRETVFVVSCSAKDTNPHQRIWWDNTNYIPPNIQTIGYSENNMHGFKELESMIMESVGQQKNADDQTTVFFDSLSTLLHDNNTDSVVKLVENLSNLLDEDGILVYYHLDPRLHEENVVNTFKKMFDTIAELSTHGTKWMIRQS